MKTLGYFAAIVGGAVAGATAALLLAPEKLSPLCLCEFVEAKSNSD